MSPYPLLNRSITIHNPGSTWNNRSLVITEVNIEWSNRIQNQKGKNWVEELGRWADTGINCIEDLI